MRFYQACEGKLFSEERNAECLHVIRKRESRKRSKGIVMRMAGLAYGHPRAKSANVSSPCNPNEEVSV